MKKRYGLTFADVSFIEIADFLLAFWIVGLLLAVSPIKTLDFFVEWKWAFFALAIIIGIKPVWRMIYGPHSDEAKPIVSKKKRRTVRKSAGRKKK